MAGWSNANAITWTLAASRFSRPTGRFATCGIRMGVRIPQLGPIGRVTNARAAWQIGGYESC
jgi:hypothetical protein